jgi:pimeloyl-ACP methyl ester carboxylesterase
MRTSRKSLLGALAGALVVAGTVLTPVAPGAAAAEGSAIDWQPCPGSTDTDVDCATIQVPLDYSKPDGEKIEVGFARRKAKDQANKIGSLLIHPGGPGQSGVSILRAGQVVSDKVADRFDVIGLDPRGVLTSTQVDCDSALVYQSLDAQFPANQGESDKLTGLNRKRDASCRELSGDLVDHMDSRNTVRDIDAIRAALGDEKLNFLGYSYGTLAGQQYAEMFPNRIRAIVMDSNIDHSLRTAWDYMSDETEAVETAFVKFGEWCGTTEKCALHDTDTRKVYAELKRKAKAGELVQPETGEPVDFHALTLMTYDVTKPESWPMVAENLKALRDGKGTISDTNSANAEELVFPHSTVWCSDWSQPIRDYAEYKSMREKLADKFPNVEYSYYIANTMQCVGGEIETTNPQRPLDIDGAPPMVMIGNRYDASTPYAWSRTAAEQSGAVLITYEGWGHTIYGDGKPSTCVNDAVDSYLIDLEEPEDGLRCPATEQPGKHAGLSEIGEDRGTTAKPTPLPEERSLISIS